VLHVVRGAPECSLFARLRAHAQRNESGVIN
jgi:hypothetical protein